MNNFFAQLRECKKSESSYLYKIYYKEDRFKVSLTAEDSVRFYNCLITQRVVLTSRRVLLHAHQNSHWSLSRYRQIRTTLFYFKSTLISSSIFLRN